jgi:hydrogenase maturation protein HypF
MPAPSSLAAWQSLEQRRLHPLPSLRERFVADPSRTARMQAGACGITLDYSKNLLDDDELALLLRLADETDAALGTARFQATLAAALEDWVARAATLTGCTTVVLCGGCLHNRLLADALSARLPARGLETLGALRLSPGDAGLALGQAWVALHRLEDKES